MSTWPWWAVGSPDCGRRTTWPRPTPGSASSSSSGTSPASAPRGATGAGARPCSPHPEDRLDQHRPGPAPARPCGGPWWTRWPRWAGWWPAERIGCGFALGGTVVLARTGGPAPAGRDEVADGPATPGSARRISGSCRRPRPRPLVGATDVLGGTYTPHCAAVDPGPAGPGPGRAVEARGVTIYEQTEVRPIRPGVVRDRPGDGAGGHRGPGDRGVHPDPAGRGAHAGPGVLTDDRHRAPARRVLGRGRTGPAGDLRRPPPPGHLRAAHRGRPAWPSVAAGRRTTSAPAIRPEFDGDARVHEALRPTLVDLFPALADAAITHRWGGPLGHRP